MIKIFLTILLMFLICTTIKPNLSPKEWQNLHSSCTLGQLNVLYDLMINQYRELENLANRPFPSCPLKNSPLHLAAFHNKKEIVYQLLKIGSNINARNLYGMTPLYLAELEGHAEIIKILIRHGALKNIKPLQNKIIPELINEYPDQKIVSQLQMPLKNNSSFPNFASSNNAYLSQLFTFLLLSLCYVQSQIG
ncbi:ankyrin repeat domain-containing protein [Candidatus Babeliales bacterium]|nr:ankyrin repeat domain-containing protein [Candidatus Babeliales bacterium]